MKKNTTYLFLIPLILIVVIYSCNKKNKDTETITTGKVNILVDETLMPIVDDQVAVYESKYNAKITLIPESESEALNSIATDKAKIIIAARKFTNQENKVFEQKKIIPRVTVFAKDAIALIKNKKSNDTLIELNEIILFLNQKPSKIKGLVFDNPNSSTVNYLCNLAKVKQVPAKNIFSFKTNNEVLKYISENEGMIGVVGVNWISQPMPEMESIIDKVNVLYVKSNNSAKYIYPSQDNITQGIYPLARDLYIINCQGKEGLGMGFASFMAGEIGQRIILKSGLVPVNFPQRNIRIVKNK